MNRIENQPVTLSHSISYEAELGARLRVIAFMLNGLLAIYLGYLVATLAPLPSADLKVDGILSMLYGIASIIFVWRLHRFRIFSFPILFLIATFAYTQSFFILYSFDGFLAIRIQSYWHEEAALRTVPILMLLFTGFNLGALLFEFTKARIKPAISHSLSPTMHTVIRHVGWTIYLLFFGLLMYHTARGSGLAVALNNSYVGSSQYGVGTRTGFADLTMSGDLPFEVIAALNWFMPLCSVILLTTGRERKEMISAIAATIITCVVGLIAGSRTSAIVLMALLIPALHINQFKVKISTLISVTFLSLFVIITWSQLRTIPGKEWTPTVIWQAFTEATAQKDEQYQFKTPLGQTFAELSASYITLVGTVRFVPSFAPFHYGKDYVDAFSVIIPYVGGRFNISEQKPAAWIKNKIAPNFKGGLGFLQVAESYLEFGSWGVVITGILMGFLLPTFWQICQQKTDVRIVTIIFIFIFSLLVWVRNDSYIMVRLVSWGIILIYVFPALLHLRPHVRK